MRRKLLWLMVSIFLVAATSLIFVNSQTEGVSNSNGHSELLLQPRNKSPSSQSGASTFKRDSQLTSSSVLPREPNLIGLLLELAGLPGHDENQEGNYLMKGYGHFTQEDKQAYETYDHATLNAFASNGDLLALQILADDAFANYPNDPDGSMNIIFNSVVHGSTNSVISLSLLQQDARIGTPDHKEALLDSLAWLEFGVLRGDPFMTKLLRDELSSERFQGITHEDMLEAKSQAHLIYENIIEKRTALGLGDFPDDDELKRLNNYFSVFAGDYDNDNKVKYEESLRR